MRTRVKICGITHRDDALHCANAGADAVGLVFYAASPRAVGVDQAAGIVDSLPAFVSTVGLFVDADKEQIDAVLREVKLDCLQFHGSETVAYCEQFDRPYIKAIRMENDTDVAALAREYHSARALLLDAYVAEVPGGTGQTFNWERVPGDCEKPLILAGGLTPENVAEAIRIARPYAVDVSGGVERAKGIKDVVKIEKFIQEVECSGTKK